MSGENMMHVKFKKILLISVNILGLFAASNHAAWADPWTENSTQVYTSDTSKYVGIGINSPITRLDVRGTSATTASTLQIVGTATSTLFLGQDGDGGVIRGQGGNNSIKFLVGGNGDEAASASGTEAMRINSGGYVGIGINSPITRLDVRGTSATTASTIQIVGTATSTLFLGQDGDGGVIRGQGGNNNIKFLVGGGGDQAASASGTTMMRVNSTGVGVGANVNPSIDFAVGDSDTGLNQVSDGELAITTNNVERVRITSGGRVGIGTTDTTGKKVNILFNSASNTALYAENEYNGASNTVGIHGVVLASGNGSNGQPVAVRGDAKNSSPSEGQYGVVGYSWATSQTSGLQGAGVFGGSVGNPSSVGDYTGRGHGIQGETNASNDNSAGGIFYANNMSGGEADAVRGIISDTTPAADAYAIKGTGNSIVSGTKSAEVNTEMQGPTEVYSIESSEIWFEDIGEAQLVEGEAIVEIDPLFLQTVTINDKHPMQVFIQPYSSDTLYVERGRNSFIVRAKDNPTSSASFGYRIMGKREHYEDQRLRQTTGPIDHFMEPDLTFDELLELNERWGLGDSFRDTYYHQFYDAVVSE